LVASDLSVPLLQAIRRKQVKEYGQRDCRVLQLNADELVFQDAQFDLVVGGAILHHLLDPEKSIRSKYLQLDDKWMFTSSYLHRVAHRCGFTDLAVYPLYGVDKLFSSQVGTYPRVAGGLEFGYLPEWAQKVSSGAGRPFFFGR
jgi:hypothetical protein